MIWLLLCCGALLSLPLEKLGIEAAAWPRQYNLYLWIGILLALSFFASQGLMLGWGYLANHLAWQGQQKKLRQMIACLDFNEKAILREFVLQRKSVIKLPVTEPAVKNLLEAGVLTYAYGQPHHDDDIQIKALMITLAARPLTTYKVLGLSKGKMSDEQMEQILSARPKYAAKGTSR